LKESKVGVPVPLSLFRVLGSSAISREIQCGIEGVKANVTNSSNMIIEKKKVGQISLPSY